MQIHTRTATALAGSIRDGALTCREVVEAHLARIEAVNGAMNAITVVDADGARAAADALDGRRPTGPLHGVPITVKENIDCVGTATTHGVRVLRDARPYEDAPVVARLKAAGAIVIGRTNQSEMGLRVCTDNPLRGCTRNPWDARLTIGGSSGGDAAAVATGMAPLGLGNDMGGSLRVPAACAGVAALKPTAGRVPHAASLPPRDYGASGQLMLAHGPIARTVADLRLVLGVIAGRHVRDPRSVDAPLVGPMPARPRVALVTDIGVELSSAARSALDRAAGWLADAGWIVEAVDPPELGRVIDVWSGLVTTDFTTLLPMMRPVISETLFDYLDRFCTRFPADTMSNHRLHTERARLGRAWSGFLTEYDVALGPNLPGAPWALDADLDGDDGLNMLSAATRFTLPANALGLPCAAVPTGVIDGLPTGVQIYADLWREDLCLAAGDVIEAGRTPVLPVDPVPYRSR